MDLFDTCEFGNLTWPHRQKAAGTLPNLMQKIANNWYPQELAAKNGHLSVVKWLVQESGQPVDVAADGNDAVRWAARFGHLDVVKWLVQESGQSVDVTAADNEAIRSAAYYGHLGVVKWFVKDYTEWLTNKKLVDPSFAGQPVDVTAENNDMLRQAVEDFDLELVRWLVEDSAQPVNVDDGENSALHVASKNELDEFSAYLTCVKQPGLDNFRVAMRALDGNLEAVKDLEKLMSDGLSLTDDDIRALSAPGRRTRFASAKRL